MSTKVLLIGIDGANAGLLKRWSRDGVLPTVGRLRRRGITIDLQGPPGFGDDAIWPSFSTGTSPARHGRYFFTQLLPGSYRSDQFRNKRFAEQPFWIPLSRAGRRLAVIDVPKSPFVEGLDGVQIADWLVHGRDFQRVRSWPRELADEVVTRFGAPPPSVCGMLSPNLSRQGYLDMMGWLRQSVAQKKELSLSLLGEGNWDAFVTVFKESHCVGHMCWHLHDRGHPQYSRREAESIGDPVRAIYIEIDSAIDSLLQRCDPDTTVIVFSLIGMGANITGQPLLDEILRRLEANRMESRSTVFAAFRSTWRILPDRVRASLRPLFGRSLSSLTELEFRSRPFFPIAHNESAGAIRLNVAGREPNGRIRRGEEYDTVCRTLAQDLAEIRDADTDLPLVEKVLPIQQIYRGPEVDNLPDLLVVWNRQRPIASATSPKIGEIRLPYPDMRSGNHLPDGMLIASGPGIEQGTQVAAASVTDIAATVAALLGEHLPDCDGTPIEGLCVGAIGSNCKNNRV